MTRGDRWAARALGGLALAVLLALAGLPSPQGAPNAGGPPKLSPPPPPGRLPPPVPRRQHDAAPPPAGPAGAADGGDMMGMVGGMEGRSQRIRARAEELATGGAALGSVLLEARDRFLEGRGAGHGLLVAVLFAVMLGVGGLAERGFQLAVHRIRRSLDGGAGAGLAAQAIRLVVRLAFDLLGLVAFAAGGLALFFALYQGHEPSRRLVLTYLAAVLVVRVIALISRTLLAPAAPTQRLVPFGDAAAGRLHHAVIALAAFYAFGTGT